METKYLIEGPITQKVISKLLAKTGERSDTGGHSVFIGQVRADEVNGKKVKSIEYSAYKEMVKIEADKIKNAVFMEFTDVKSIDFLHSTGIVHAGKISLFVLVSAGHRRQSIEACSKTVEFIKEKLPVWKKEIFDDKSHKWKQNDSAQTGS